MYEASESTGVRLAPSFSYPAERFATNRLGLRDRERDAPRSGRRIALLGDSFTAGVGVNDQQHSAALLEGALDGVEVWNLGTPHFGLEQSWRRLEELWPEVEPDVVVLQIFPGNDAWDDARGPAWMTVVDGEIAALGWAPSASPLDPLRPDLHRPLFVHHIPGDGWIWRHSHAYRGALAAASAVLDRLGADWSWGMEPFDYEAFGAVAWLYLDPPPPPVAGAWTITEQALVRLQAFVEAQGATLLLASVPARTEVDAADLDFALDEGWSSGPRQGGGSVDGRRTFNVDLPQQIVAAMASRRGLPLLDYRPAFVAANKEERTHYLDDSHWTAGGHREAARALGRFLSERGHVALPEDFDARLDAAVPEAAFEVEFEGGFREDRAPFEDADGSQVGGVRGGRARAKSGGSEIPPRLGEPFDLLPLLPPAPEGWTRGPADADVAPLPFPREDVVVAQARATYRDPEGRPHEVRALDGGGQPEIDQWFRDLGPRAVVAPVPEGVLPTAARVGLVLPEAALHLGDAVDRDALAAAEAALAPSGKLHPTLVVEDVEGGHDLPRGVRRRLRDPAELVAALPPAPPGWQVLDTMPMYRPHHAPEFPDLPPWMEALFDESPDLAEQDGTPWTAQVKRWYRGPAGSFALVVQDTGMDEVLLRNRQTRLVRVWTAQTGAEPPAASATPDPELRRWSAPGLRGFRTCRVEQGLCKVVVPLVDPAAPDAPLARYNAILMGPPGADDAAYAALIAPIDRQAFK